MDLVDLSETSSISALLSGGRFRKLCKALIGAEPRNVHMCSIPRAILLWESPWKPQYYLL